MGKRSRRGSSALSALRCSPSNSKPSTRAAPRLSKRSLFWTCCGQDRVVSNRTAARRPGARPPHAIRAGVFLLLTASAAWTAPSPGSGWQRRSAPIPNPGLPNPLSGVAYGAGRFVAVGSLVALGTFMNPVNRGVILTSETGERWDPQPSPQDVMLSAVAYGAGHFVAVGQGGTILSSADGTAWARESSPMSSHLFSIACTSNRFVAVGYAGSMTTQATN